MSTTNMPRRNPRRNIPPPPAPASPAADSSEEDLEEEVPAAVEPPMPDALQDALARIADLEGRVPRGTSNNDANMSDDSAEDLFEGFARSIPGYKGGRELGDNEWEFYQEMKSLGITNESVDELFRQGYTDNESFSDFSDDNVKTRVVSIGKNKSPACPDASKVFLSSSFMSKLCLLVSWIAFQKQIGGDNSPAAWLKDALSPHPRFLQDTKDRLRFNKQAKQSREATKDTTMPPKLHNMKKFREFDEHLQNYLRAQFGAAGVPLTYVIRRTKEVTQAARKKRVGVDYEDWNHYCICCTLLDGPHWGSDNNSLWQIISHLVRSGPGWDYVRRFETSGGGDGRGAYFALYEQAYQYTHIRTLKSEAYNGLNSLRFTGPSKNFTWDQYVGKWYKHMNDLERLLLESCRRIIQLQK